MSFDCSQKGLTSPIVRPSTRRRLPPLALATLPLMLCCTVQPLYAQPRATPALEEVVVTASRREEGLQSVAASITAVTGADLDKQGITGFSQMAGTVSGLELKQPRGMISSALYIRGVGTSGNTPADPSVGVLIDGVYQHAIGAVFTELLDIERIEVLRGPQGTLFGKNTTAGVIRVFTEKPDTREFSGRLQGIAGNLDNRELRGLVNIPLIEGKLGARLGAYTAKRDGYVDNLFTGEDTRNIDRHGWRAGVLWDAADNLQFRFTAEQHDQKARMDSALVRYPDDLLDRFGAILPPIAVGKVQQGPESTWEEVGRYVLHADWGIANHTFSLISSVEQVDAFQLQDRDATILAGELGSRAITGLSNLAERDIYTHELQLTSGFDGPLNYILGVFWQKNERLSITDLYMGAGIYAPRPPSPAEYSTQAAFGNVTYEFSNRWDVSAGFRYTEDEQVGSNNLFDGTVNFYEGTYSLKLRHHLDDDRMVYFSHDKGFKSGGINRELSACGRGGACLTADQAFWDPEITYNYEIGIKSEWFDRRLRLNAALFYQTYEDFQVNQTVPGDATVLLTNAAEVTSKGIEADFVWLATDRLMFSGNMAYMKTEYDDYQGAPCALPSSPGCVNGAQDLSGETLDNAPEFTYSLSGEYRDAFRLIDGGEWFGRLQVSYKDDFNLFLALPPETRQESYYLINARVGVEAPGSWRVTLWGNNLADEEYLVDAELSDRGLQQIPGVQRTYGVTLDWYF